MIRKTGRELDDLVDDGTSDFRAAAAKVDPDRVCACGFGSEQAQLSPERIDALGVAQSF